MATFEQTYNHTNLVQNAETILNGALPAPANLSQAGAQIAASREALSKIPELPTDVRDKASGHLEAAAKAAQVEPLNKKTVADHLDATKKVLESAAGMAKTVVNVIGAVAAIGAAIAGFTI